MRVAVRIGVVAALVLGGVGLLGVSSAQACSCAGWSEQQSFAAADVAFEATLPGNVALDREPTSENIAVPFQVSRIFKGELDADQAIRTSGAGASCGLELRGDRPFLIFAIYRDQNLETGLCSGSRTLDPDEELAFGLGRPVTITLATGDDDGLDPGLLALAAGLGLATTAAGVVAVRRRRRT